jgi:hypothetical protein
MALIPCEACGKQISIKATTCPQCGHPSASSKGMPILKRAKSIVVNIVWSILTIIFILGLIVKGAEKLAKQQAAAKQKAGAAARP